jgi:hypothetical protein
VERQAVLGGPGFQTSIPSWEAWPDQHGSTSWTRRFLDVLRSHHALGELGFFSFEWYPFDNVCRAAGRQLIEAPALLAEQLRQLARDGLPGRIPKVISEYGYSSYSARAEVDLPAALLNADLVAQFLSLGGRAAYLYGYEPSPLIREPAACDSWGQLALLQSDQNRRIVHVLAAYQAARMLTQTWAQPGRRTHRLYEVTADLPTAGGGAPVTAYAVRRPDGRLAVLLINKDPARSIAVRVRLRKGVLRGPMDLFQFSRRQYRWHARGPGGYPSPDRAPAHAVLRGPVLRLPPFSLSVLRTRGRLTVA